MTDDFTVINRHLDEIISQRDRAQANTNRLDLECFRLRVALRDLLAEWPGAHTNAVDKAYSTLKRGAS